MQSRTVQLLTGFIQLGLIGLILFAPLPFGSVGAGPVLAIEAVAILLGVMACVVVWLDRDRFTVPLARALVPALGILAIGVLQLLPLGHGWAAAVAPRVAELRDVVGQTVPIETTSRVSLTPSAGADAVARFAAYVWIGFAAAVGVRTRRALRLIALAAAVSAAFQGLYGAYELLSGRQQILGFVKQHYTDEATGTFVNRNHYAGFLALCLPLTLALLSSPLPGSRFHGWRQRLLRTLQPRFLFRVVLVLAVGCTWLGVVLSYSRAGLVVTIVGCGIVCLRLWGRSAMLWLAVASLALPTGYLLLKDIRTPGARLQTVTEDVASDQGRIPVWKATSQMAADHWVLGTGFGSFDAAFPLYRPPAINVRWNHAHNDWLQSAAEGGWLTPLLLIAIGIPIVRRRGTATSSRLSSAIHLAALAGVVAVALHSAVDFPLKIPAIAAVAAILIGIRCSDIPEQNRIESVR